MHFLSTEIIVMTCSSTVRVADCKNIPAQSSTSQKANSRRLDKSEKNVLVHLLQAPKLTNGDIAKIIDVDERTISRRRKQLRTLGHLSPERNVKGAQKLMPWHLEKIIALLEENDDFQLKDVQDFLQKEFDLHVTVSTISRQLSRAGHARARRPGYKNTRPDLQAQEQEQQQQTSPETVAHLPDVQSFLTPGHQLQSPIQGQVQEDVAENANSATPQGAVKLACPFFKYNPERYINGPFCQSSWHSVRDVKEHVFRQHMHPKFRCNRCMETFCDNKVLIYHQRLPEPCALAEWAPDEGCDEEQKEKIRRGDKGDEHARWKRMFSILFPDVDEAAIPDGFLYDSAAYFAPAAIDPDLNVAWQGDNTQVLQGVA
ncbi:hypothetical protein N0V82_010530 [Gnomoniopsis sp. IMI 355080]|nr:hypothetical protein N0V82_010530 [Gnomoniopsis sp. IMI 355080]